jgi:hypothetical protein
LRRLDVIGPGRDFGSEVPNAVYRVVWEKVLTKRLKVQPPEMGALQGAVVQVEAVYVDVRRHISIVSRSSEMRRCLGRCHGFRGLRADWDQVVARRTGRRCPDDHRREAAATVTPGSNGSDRVASCPQAHRVMAPTVS